MRSKSESVKIGILGGSSASPGSPTYQAAYEIGKAVAQLNATVISGGYIGAMEAVSKGAAKAGGHVIGFKCHEVEIWKDVQPNPWSGELWPCETMLDLFLILIKKTDALLVLDGGVGTLVEVALAWNQMVIGAIDAKPLILIGKRWQSSMKIFMGNFADLISEEIKTHIEFAQDYQTAITLLKLKGIL